MERASAVNYAQQMTLHVQLRDDADGQIYPPYLRIKYASASTDNYDNVDLTVRSVVVFMFGQLIYF